MKISAFAAVLLVAGLIAAAPLSSHAAGPAPEAKKIARLLDGSGLHYETRKASVWTVDFTGKKIGRSTVVVTYDKTLLVMFAVVAKSATMQKTGPMMQILLHANHQFDYVKIGFDDDGDLFVRIDAPLRITDARQLRDDVKQVMTAAEDLSSQIAKFRR